jgi:thiosulfate/3-mercaptopyruvate sulfurtransferase
MTDNCDMLTPMPTTLISTDALAAQLSDPTWAVIDTRFDLARPEWGQEQYRAGHVPGAVYAHMDRDLSGAKTGTNGRHPLPDIHTFIERLGGWGVGPGVQVVVYDQQDGMNASRLWWMLRYLGHTAVAVLDGGWAKWEREGRPARSGDETRTPAQFVGAPQPGLTVSADEVDRMRQDANQRVLDARAPERYRGETEPLDLVAGHIPGAVNYWFKNNVNPDGTFRSADEVHARLQAALGAVPPNRAAVYCGSGITACHDLLAAEYAGLPGLRLYPGSWSEWSADPSRPVATGPA